MLQLLASFRHLTAICLVVMEMIYANECPGEDKGNTKTYAMDGSDTYKIQQIAKIIDALENLHILDGSKQSCYMLSTIAKTTEQENATLMSVDLKLFIKQLGPSSDTSPIYNNNGSKCTGSDGLVVVNTEPVNDKNRTESTTHEKGNRDHDNVTAGVVNQKPTAKQNGVRRYGKISGTQLLVICTCSTVIGLFFITALIMRIRNYVKRQREGEIQASRPNFRSTSVALRGENATPSPRKDSVNSKFGYTNQVTWPQVKYQNGSPFHKPPSFHGNNQDNKPLLVITSASAPSSPLILSKPAQQPARPKEKVRYMPSDPGSGASSKQMSHLTVQHRSLYRQQRRPSKPREVQTHTIPCIELNHTAPHQEDNHIPHGRVMQNTSCGVLELYQPIKLINAAKSEHNSNKIRTLNLNFDEYYRGESQTPAAKCNKFNNKDSYGSTLQELSSPSIPCDSKSTTIDTSCLSSPSGYASSFSSNTGPNSHHNTDTAPHPTNVANSTFTLPTNSDLTESSFIQDDISEASTADSVSDSSDDQHKTDQDSTTKESHLSNCFSDVKTLSDKEQSCDLLKDKSTTAPVTHPYTSSSSFPVSKSVSFVFDTPRSAECNNELQHDDDCLQDDNNEARTAENSLLLRPEFQDENTEAKTAENSLLLRPEFQGMKPTYV